MQAKSESVIVITGTWQGFSANADNARVGLATRLARRIPEGNIVWFSVPRKPTADACIEAFQKARDLKVTWILWADDDVVFPPDVFDRLREVADEKERPVVSALGFFRQPPFWPSIFRYDRLGDGTIIPTEKPLPWLDYPRNQLVRVDATGLCACLIHTSVLNRIKEPWFSWLATSKGGHTPDGQFMYRLSEADIPIYCHTGVKVRHETTLEVGEDTYDDWIAKHGLERSRELMQRNFRPMKPVEESRLVPVDPGRPLVSQDDGGARGTDAVCEQMVNSDSGKIYGGRKSDGSFWKNVACPVCHCITGCHDGNEYIPTKSDCSCVVHVPVSPVPV